MIEFIIEILLSAFAIFVMWACCTRWQEKTILRRLMPVIAAAAIGIDYYVTRMDNLLWLIAMLLLIWIYKWKTSNL